MQVLQKQSSDAKEVYEAGGVIKQDIIVRTSEEQLVAFKAGTQIDENIKELLDRGEEVYLLRQEELSTEALLLEIKHNSCKTLLQRVKHFKNDPAKVFNILFRVNEQIFKDFKASSQNQIDMICVNSVVESLIFLVNNDSYHLKNSMQKLLEEYKLSVHSFNVAFYALHLGVLLELNVKELKHLGIAGLLHDVGKKKLEAIIDKHEALKMEELENIQKHSEYSLEILKENKIQETDILEAVIQHHERYDGSGYPKGLHKEEISKFGSILAICDVFDAMTIDRPYRDSYTSFDSLRLMIMDPSLKKQFNHTYIKKLLISIGTD